MPGDQARLDLLAVGVLAAGDDADRLDGRDLDPAQVAQQPVLAAGDRLAGLLDGVHLVLEPHEADDVARDAAGERRPGSRRPTPRAAGPTAASPAPGAAWSRMIRRAMAPIVPRGRGGEGAPVRRRTCPAEPGELVPQRGRRRIPAGDRDLLHRQSAVLEQRLGPVEPSLGEPAMGRGPGRGTEATQEGAFAQPGTAGQLGHGERLVEPALDPFERLGQHGVVGCGRGGDRCLDELCLSAGPVRCRHHPAGQRGRVGHSPQPPDEVQAEVDGGHGAGAGQDSFVVDVQRRRVHLGGREPVPELLLVDPVHGAVAVVEETRVAEGEDARTEAGDPGAATGGVAQHLDDRFRRPRAARLAGGDDEQVGGGGELQRGEPVDAVAGPALHRLAPGRAHRELPPLHPRC